MRRASTLLALTCALLISQTSLAKIWRVNNNSGVNADFTTLQAAHDGATAGDTLHIEGSPNPYGGASFNKKLTVLGTGYFLEENLNLQALQQSSKVQGITLNMGSEGTLIMGLDFQGNGVSVFTDDIIIRRNKFCGTYSTTQDYYIGTINLHYHSNNGAIAANNIIISQNFGVRVAINNPSTGVLVTNNLLQVEAYHGDQTTQSCLGAHANAILLVQNNIIKRGKVSANNSNFTNNIMVNGFFEGVGNLYSNNIASGTQFGIANGNQQNVTMTTVFVGEGTGITYEGQWKLKAGSPAIGAGYGSTGGNPIDCGMFSGQNPYILAGMPPMPAIYSFEVQPIGSNTDPIDVKVKVKSAGN
ncbi:hypothetical protein [Paraflavitalea sp. CAU 1676]|uniref:hypothetical protein n=1 Tax=Paraflavitalea sp. CAU 1676 TaxID=3032598 RepID=UPI0023DBA1A6|nr:hypothetical protein [Paraflavitalea sp. CAU 1676]MDF2188549.1 hypothetical protein [Paraflavitalea sp. CAU 1676]